ncbi:DUF448 domain-containing protein [Altererythrobacter sp. ZODW24]|uniref:DUF448 domain-containing protein n=1 Tax=Altererythrobacter sp. ZODW24 TaxID=2185142 RepID=UPI000DF869A2|nr:DUF448 domain-containing protein [Altererythrobacter sp. ZODW24]
MRNPPHEPLGSGISDGEQARKPAPERRCVLAGETAPRDGLVRLAISPDGDVLPDIHAKAPGRGAWIGVNRAELETAIEKGALRGALARAFKGAKLAIPAELPQMIEDALLRSFTDRLGLAMRAGHLLVGSDRIAQSARSGQVAWLAHASDAKQDGSSKLDQAWRVGLEEEGSGRRGMRLPLDRAALSVALGRDNVVHLALADAKAAERVLDPLQRLLHFAGETPAENEDENGNRAVQSHDALTPTTD